MEDKVLGILLAFGVLITTVISGVICFSTRNKKTKKEEKVHKVSKILFLITFTLCAPGITFIYFIIKLCSKHDWIVDLIFDLGEALGGSSTSSYSSDYSENSSSSSTKTTEEPSEKSYYHYNEDKISTIYSNGTVIRSDGVSGHRHGDFIHYENGSIDHILNLGDDDNVIEKWQ